MLSARALRMLRPCVAPLSVGNTHSTLARHDAPFTGAVRGRHRTSRDDVGRFLILNYKCPWLLVRPVTTVTHSEDGNLIYTGSLGSAIRGVKLFSYSTSGVSLFLMPYILQKTGLGVQSFGTLVTYGVLCFLTFCTPVLLHLVTKGYVTRLYHNPDRDTYTAITYSLFLTEKKKVFHQRQVKIPAVSKMFTTFYADRMGLLVNPDLFPVPHDYNHLMGYDKPFMFDTDSINGPDKD